MTKEEMPDRIWARDNGDWLIRPFYGDDGTEYRRADLPTTPAEAMRCPEVRALCLEVHTAMCNHGHALVNLRELRTALTALEQVVRHE